MEERSIDRNCIVSYQGSDALGSSSISVKMGRARRLITRARYECEVCTSGTRSCTTGVRCVHAAQSAAQHVSARSVQFTVTTHRVTGRGGHERCVSPLLMLPQSSAPGCLTRVDL
eukprot:1182667-Prorocentrum_minimum.AAC.3